MRDAHRADEVLLEARLGRGLDLLDAPDDVFDFYAGGAIEQGDAGAGASGVAGAGHVLGLTVRYEAEHHRVDGVDVGAERAGQPDPVDVIDPVVVHQQAAAGVQRTFRELDLPDVVLGEHEPRFGVVDDVGARAAVVDHAVGSLLGRGIDHAVGGQDPGEVQLCYELDDARAADAGGRGRLGVVRPELAADRAEPQLEGLGVDPDTLDRAGRRPLAARDLGTFERGPGRTRRGEQTVSVAEHDLGVGPDVD